MSKLLRENWQSLWLCCITCEQDWMGVQIYKLTSPLFSTLPMRSYWKGLSLNPLGRGGATPSPWLLPPDAAAAPQAASLGHASPGWGRPHLTPGPPQLLEDSEPTWRGERQPAPTRTASAPDTGWRPPPCDLSMKPFLLFCLSFTLVLGWKY